MKGDGRLLRGGVLAVVLLGGAACVRRLQHALTHGSSGITAGCTLSGGRCIIHSWLTEAEEC